VLQFLVITNAVPGSLIFMEVIFSIETSVLARASPRNIPEDGIPQIHRHESLKPYMLMLLLKSLTNIGLVPFVLVHVHLISSVSSSIASTE
jgi:hypothetical protein